MREINNMEELKMAQIELRHKVAMKELQLKAHANSIRELLNPMTYVNAAISKLASIEQLAASFWKGYTTFKDLIAKYRNRNEDLPDGKPDNQ